MMAAYKARNCSGYPMSTGQGIKSRPAIRCNYDCKQGRTCDCTDKPAAMDRISAVRLTLLVYALVALAIYFSL